MSELLDKFHEAYDLFSHPSNPPQILTIRKYPNEILKRVSEEVPICLALYKLADIMVKTMEAHKGIGLAAVQVGIPFRLIVVKLSTGAVIKMANPKIVQVKGKPVFKEEGCLSFPKALAMVKRNTTIICEYFNLETDNVVRRTFTNRDAHVIQHEIDHLDGITTADKLDFLMRKKFIAEFQKSDKPNLVFNDEVAP